jgi:hypothetical protein
LKEPEDEDANTGKEPRFTVTISNPTSGETMVCKCEAGAEPSEEGEEDSHVFIVTSVGVVPKGGNDAETYMSDPNYWDDDLEQSLREYLASNGVDDAFIEELCYYVQDKEYADYVDVLGKLSKFVQ